MSTSSKTSSSHRNETSTPINNFVPQNIASSPILGESSTSSLYQQYESIDKPLLIDKILRIQKLHHKKNDKIEQLLSQNEEHAKELKKQSLVIKHLLFKIPADSRENNNSQSSKNKRNLAVENPTLLLEMNAKLQVLLEDTISQNAALKDNLKTLGNQIAKK